MKPTHDPNDPSCSCTSCTYKSVSEQPSIRRFIVDGSKIDKLYIGKYIPLRERKLLDRLVRTRAVYDDIRNQLISDSDASVKPNLKPRKNQQHGNDLRGNKSGSISELVDMVDKGNIPDRTDLSECCSCCICGSKIIHTHHEHMEMRKHKHRYGRGAVDRMSLTSSMIKQKMREAKRGFVHRISRSSMMMMRQKMRDARRGVRARAKSIMSDPCTCTSQLTEEVTRRSKEVARRFRPNVQLGEQTMFEGVLSKRYSKAKPPLEAEISQKEHKRGKALRKSYHKIKKSRFIESIEEGARKVKESKTKIKKHIEAEVKKSVDKIIHGKDKINEHIKAAVRKSIQDLDFPIKKDSIVKFKEKIKTRKQMQDFECQHECIATECVPEECLKILKLRKNRKGKKHKSSMESFSETGVQARQQVEVTTNEIGQEGKNLEKIDRVDKRRIAMAAKYQQQKVKSAKKGAVAEPRISIEIGTKKKRLEDKSKVIKPKVKTRENYMESPKNTRSVESTTNVTPVSSKHVSSGPEQKQSSKKQKAKLQPSVVLKTRKRPSGQKAVKDSPSFSFSIEYRKGNEQQKQIPRPIYIQKRDRIQGAKNEHKSVSQTKIGKSSRRELQTGGHALKRCFCTLKLKGKGYKSRPSRSLSTETRSQTRKLDQLNANEHVQTRLIKSREMACVTCSQEHCDPRECVKIMKHRHRRVGETKTDSKSISSVTSRSRSTSSKSTTTDAPQKLKKGLQKLQPSPDHIKPQYESGQGEQKQAVRISSSFSFSVEFYKDKPAGDVKKSHEERTEKVKRRNTGTHRIRHLRHKHSQISSLTGKSKYTLTKHSLKRCFCTLKLGQTYKKKTKPLLKSTGSSTSQQYTPDMNHDIVSVHKGVATDKQKKYRLLPYECEPGICIPGECDPYVCLELINKRQNKFGEYETNMNHRSAKKVITDYPETKSMSSFTSRPNKVKTVQSTTDTIVREHRNKEKLVRQVKTTPSSPNRQVVRISSSFSFNIEFYKNTSSPNAIDVPLERPSQVSATAKRRRSKERSNQDRKTKKHQQSTSMLVKKKNRGSFIAPMKRCFCTLKLQTTDLKENATIGTETPVKNAVDYKNVLITKGTKTKHEKYGYILEPYECEPGVCVPGLCDPYECLQRIQMQQLKESGTGTDKAKMKSAKSVTQKGKFRSKSALAQSKSKGQKVSTMLQKIKKIPDHYTAAENQAVRIGSNFSFNIEFYKDKKQSSVVKVDNPSEISNMKAVKKLKHRGAKIRGTSSSHQDTQASISLIDKAAGIRPILKRCFCTLKLQGNQNKKVKTNVMTPNVIAVSRVTVTETKIKSLNNMFINELAQTDDCANDYWATALYDFQSSTSTISKASIVFRYKEMQSYFRKSSRQSMRSNKLSNNILKTSHRNVLARSNSILPNYYSKVDEKFSYSENCTISCQSKLCLKRKKSLLKYKRAYLNSQSSIISEPLMNYPSLSKLRKQDYYTMNIQIPEKKNKYKLKPYECEPGVCIPDHCDPYECQKLIMKRLMKKVSRMSGTNMTSKSMGSSTNQSTSSSKRLQSKQQRGKAQKVAARSGGMTFKTIPSHKKHKQAVRVGSNFSFNIEFSKDRSASPAKAYVSPPSTKIRPTKPIRKKIKEQGTRGHGMTYHDQDSQFGTETANKGSGMKPMMQRCFCTLKLQKKGKNQRQQKAAQQASDRGTATPPNTMQDFITSRTLTNTGQNTTVQKPLKLLPYECEPLVCVPGECDPYECLERIKKRNLKNIGTGALQYNTSTGSMTGKKQYRTQKKQIQSKHKNRQTKSRGSTESRSSKVKKYQIRPSKQAVRIGSSFSFNVEFFKENDQAQLIAVPKAPQRRPLVVKEGVPKATVNKKKLTNKGLQDAKDVHHRDSQVENLATHGKSTMTTSFMKRCFCTANLHKKTQQVPLQNKGSQSKGRNKFVKRFSNAMQKVKGRKSPKPPVEYTDSQTETISEPTHKNKKVVTRHYKELHQELLPYECEPGICIPGECNPYECDKLIKARNINLQTREVITDRPRTRSTSSNFSSQTSKARRTQSNFKKTSSTTKPLGLPSKKVRETEPVPRVASNRQVVRIGSTFSFNVEFYKDRTPNTEEVQAAAKAVRYKPSKPKTKVAKTGLAGEKTRNTGSMGASATIDQESQANRKMHDRGSGFGSALKRCFCTLKLQQPKKPVYKTEESQATETLKVIPTHQTRGVGTGKHWKLKPYECEPGVCIPGQCNPYECEKRIQLRNMRQRDSGTSTRRKHRRKSVSSDVRSRGKSVSSDIRSNILSKARKIQYKQRKDRRRSQSVSSRPTRSRTSLDTSTRQSVRIGSGFSFDIEFHKNKANTYAEPKVQPLRYKIKPTKSITSSGHRSFSKTKNRKMQHHKGVRDTDSQIMAQKMRSTGVNPLLRRCFCTLKLQKSGDMASNPTIISRAARDKNVYMATLLPYECEPGVCIPGECDPHVCQKRIQRRLQMRSQQSGTERSSRDSSTRSTAGAKYKSSMSQSQKDRQRQKHQKGTYAKVMREYRTSEPAPSSGSSSQQAVRIGSSFKFDVEFYKSSSEKGHTVHRESYSAPKKESYSVPKKRVHDMKTKPKHKKTKNRSVTSSDIRLKHNKMQTGSGTESKSTGFGPRLKRCFCTLALNKKKTPPTTETKFTNKNDDLSDLYQYSRNVRVGTSKKYQNLKPYECEPGVCVPGSCDPYECYERIKRRMKDTSVATDRPAKKYAANSTPKNIKYKSADTQSQIPRGPRKERPTMANFKEEGRGTLYRRSPCNNDRQAVRLGSNFSFSVEFYKERPWKIPKDVRKIKALEKERKPKPSKSNKVHKVSPVHKKYANRQSFAGMSGSAKKSQVDVKNTSKGTGTGSFLKRCFCTLNLYSKNKQEKKGKVIKKPPEIPKATPKKPSKIPKEKPNKSPKTPKEQPNKPPKIPKEKPKKPLEIKREVMVQTKERHNNKYQNYSLKPYECEPNVCIPGKCDPYKCLERIKRRTIRRQSRRTGTNRRPSQISASSMASRLIPRTNRCVQSFERGKRYATRPSQGPKYVEEPRFAHVFEDMRSGVKIGSNVSFNIEFYRDKSESPPMNKEDYRPKEIKVKYRKPSRKSTISESRPKGMHKGVGNKGNKRTFEAQASGVARKDTGTGVNNMLKRCFCTLKFQKKPQNVITVNRLAIDNADRMGFNPAETFKKNHLHSLKILKTTLSNNFKNILKSKNTISFKNNHANVLSTTPDHVISKPKDKCMEMTTIYPYIPTKFNKNVSKTVLLRNNESRKISSDKTGDFFIKSHLKNSSKKELKIRYKNKKQMKNSDTVNQEREIPHIKSLFRFRRMRNITEIFHRILPRVFFTDKKNKMCEKSVQKNLVHTTMPTNKVNLKISIQDTLKTSKSDRQSRNIKKNTSPKKTISLKVTNAPEKIRVKRRKKSSRYQSVDAGQIQTTVHNRAQKSIFPGCGNIWCAYCHIVNDKNVAISPYNCTKTTRNKNNVNQTNFIGGNFDNKNETRRKGILKDPVAIKNKLSKYIHGLENNNKIKTSDDCASGCKGLLRRGKKNGSSNGDGAFSKSPVKEGRDKTVKPKKRLTKYITGLENNKIKTSDCTSDCKGLLKSGKENRLSSGGGAISKLPVNEGKEKTVTPKNRLSRYIHGLENNKKIKTSVDCSSDCKGLLRRGKNNGLSYGDGTISKTHVKEGKEKSVTPKAFIKNKLKIMGFIESYLSKPGLHECACTKKQKRNHLSAGDAPTDDERLSDDDNFIKCTPWVQLKPKTNKIEEDAKYKVKTGMNKHIRKTVKPIKYTGIKLTKQSKGYPTGPTSKGKVYLTALNSGKGNKKANYNPIALKLTVKRDPKAKNYPIAKGDTKGKSDPKALNLKKGKPVTKTDTSVYPSKHCVCGSIICSVESEKIKMIKKNIDSLKPPPCICGSKPCSLEIEKKYREKQQLEEYKKNLICQCRFEIERARKIAKERIALKKKRDLDLKNTNKRFNAEDKKRMKVRAKDDKRKMKEISKYKKSDGELAAESLLDVLTLGCTTSKDMFRSAARAMLHPRRTSANMRDMYRNPSGAVKALGSAITGSGGVHTMRRVKERFKRMRKLQRMIVRLEENRFTRYIMFMISKDARKRMLNRKRRMRRRREPIEFECSLYMASLRKRPFVAVYYTCPWFYPHCLSMLNVWKQLTEIMLFLIAVTVWSPCIVMMEVCRAAMCCFLCTGG